MTNAHHACDDFHSTSETRRRSFLDTPLSRRQVIGRGLGAGLAIPLTWCGLWLLRLVCYIRSIGWMCLICLVYVSRLIRPVRCCFHFSFSIIKLR